MTKNMTREQLRGICPACFAEQALRVGRLVDHGYRRPQHWHANVGVCGGRGQVHFGNAGGRDYTASLAAMLRLRAADDLAKAQRVADNSGTDVVFGLERVKGAPFGAYQEVLIDQPTEDQRLRYAARLRQNVSGMLAAATEFEGRVRAWQPAEPVRLTVEKKETLLHFRGGYYGGKACAASAMAAHKGYATTVLADVTCDKCKRVVAAMAARKAAAAVR